MDGGGHAWRMVVAAAPAVGALAVGVSRYTDYWHHWSDVLAGLLLGFGMAWLAYRQQKTKLARLEAPQGGASQGQLGSEDVEGQQSMLLRGIPAASEGY
jgi:membrane-associated phospholipid phosphatase